MWLFSCFEQFLWFYYFMGFSWSTFILLFGKLIYFLFRIKGWFPSFSFLFFDVWEWFKVLVNFTAWIYFISFRWLKNFNKPLDEMVSSFRVVVLITNDSILWIKASFAISCPNKLFVFIIFYNIFIRKFINICRNKELCLPKSTELLIWVEIFFQYFLHFVRSFRFFVEKKRSLNI